MWVIFAIPDPDPLALLIPGQIRIRFRIWFRNPVEHNGELLQAAEAAVWGGGRWAGAAGRALWAAGGRGGPCPHPQAGLPIKNPPKKTHPKNPPKKNPPPKKTTKNAKIVFLSALGVFLNFYFLWKLYNFEQDINYPLFTKK